MADKTTTSPDKGKQRKQQRTVRSLRRARHAGQRRRADDLNITPMMNLFVVLIPLLLMSSTFVQLAVVRNTLGVQGAASGDAKPDPNPQLMLKIYADRSELVCENYDLNPWLAKGGKPKAGSSTIKFPREKIRELVSVLVRLKNAFPAAEAMVIAPAANVPYQYVIEAMDMSRETRDGKRNRIPLFPDVAITKLAKK